MANTIEPLTLRKLMTARHQSADVLQTAATHSTALRMCFIFSSDTFRCTSNVFYFKAGVG